jgi:hypothetical protein
VLHLKLFRDAQVMVIITSENCVEVMELAAAIR